MTSLAKADANPSATGFWRSLFQVGLYKPSQGKVVRQVTAVGAAILLLMIAFELAMMNVIVTSMRSWGVGGGQYIVFVVLGILAIWIAYRLVNYPRFADFLIAVEAEMNKVSWPGRTELVRASIVVMLVIFALAIVLYAFDLFWTWFFQFLRIRN